MKSHPFGPALAALGLAAAFAASPVARAQMFFHVDVDTAVLAGHASGPFSLDFQLVDGGAASAANTATITHLSFVGGSGPSGAPTLVGGASGDLATTVSITDTSFFNEFYQGIDVGTKIGFDLSLTTHGESGAPDAFSFAILDKNLNNLTTGGPGDALLYASITPELSGADLLRYSGTGDFAGVVVTAVPEPAETGMLCALLLGGSAVVIRRIRRRG